MTPHGGVIRTLNNLSFLLQDERERRGLSMREAAEQIGVSASTLFLVELRGPATVFVAVKVLRWLDGNDSA